MLRELKASEINDDGALLLISAMIKDLARDARYSTNEMKKCVKSRDWASADTLDAHIKYLKRECETGLCATAFALLDESQKEKIFEEYEAILEESDFLIARKLLRHVNRLEMEVKLAGELQKIYKKEELERWQKEYAKYC